MLGKSLDGLPGQRTGQLFFRTDQAHEDLSLIPHCWPGGNSRTRPSRDEMWRFNRIYIHQSVLDEEDLNKKMKIMEDSFDPAKTDDLYFPEPT
jgi:hypothetical protein